MPAEGALFENGLLLVRDEASGQYGYCDATGTYVITPQFDDASSFLNGYASMCLDEKWGHIDTLG